MLYSPYTLCVRLGDYASLVEGSSRLLRHTSGRLQSNSLRLGFRQIDLVDIIVLFHLNHRHGDTRGWEGREGSGEGRLEGLEGGDRVGWVREYRIPRSKNEVWYGRSSDSFWTRTQEHSATEKKRKKMQKYFDFLNFKNQHDRCPGFQLKSKITKLIRFFWCYFLVIC